MEDVGFREEGDPHRREEKAMKEEAVPRVGYSEGP